jgi:hypothetical protein
MDPFLVIGPFFVRDKMMKWKQFEEKYSVNKNKRF